MIGTVDRQTREVFVDLVYSIVNRDSANAAQVLLKLTSWDDDPDIRKLERELSDFIGRHLFKPLKEIEIGRLLQDLLELVSHNQLRIPPDIFLMIKAITSAEGVARKLNPDFDMISRPGHLLPVLKFRDSIRKGLRKTSSALPGIYRIFFSSFQRTFLMSPVSSSMKTWP